MSYLIKPPHYTPILNLQQTEVGITKIKDFFQANLSAELRLRRVTAPLFVLRGMGLNDDLTGVERPVSFLIKDMDDAKAEVVHSLAKWKRVTLADYEIENGYGIYTDMNAIRSDEELGNLHSLYVDQWDWERLCHQKNVIDFLKKIVKRIYNTILRTEYLVSESFPKIRPILPEKFTLSMQKNCAHVSRPSPKEREHRIAKNMGLFLSYGAKLGNGENTMDVRRTTMIGQVRAKMVCRASTEIFCCGILF